MDDDTSFLGALFDFSFDRFITTRLVKVLYALEIVAAGILALAVAVTAWASSHSAFGGLVKIVVATPLTFLASVIVARIVCEGILVLFRIQAHVAELARQAHVAAPRHGATA